MQADEVRRHRRGAGAGAAREEALSDPRRGTGAASAIRARRGGPLAVEALSRVGRGDLAGGAGRVVSVHRRAINLLLDGGPLVALLPEGAPIHPWAVTVRADPGIRVELAAGSAPALCGEFSLLAPGAEVRISADVLGVGPLRIALDSMESVDLRLCIHSAALPLEALRALSRHLECAGVDGPFDSPQLAALAGFRAGGDGQDLVSIVGLGPGLTPSGDDVLVGILAGLDLAARAGPGAPILRRSLAAALHPQVLARTTAPSAQMLVAAAAGLYAEPVLGLAAALAEQDRPPRALAGAAKTLLSMGHRSGVDTLRGFAAALERVTSS